MPKQAGVTPQALTDSGGQAVNAWWPQNMGASTPLVIMSHQQAGSQLVLPNIFSYPLIYALVNAGFIVAMSANHGGDGWASAASQTDLTNAYNLVNGIQPVSSTIVGGYSMGGALTAVAVANARVPNVKACFAIDGALNLAWMYGHGYAASMAIGFALNAGTLSAASLVAATSVSSTVSIPAGTSIIIDPTGTHPETVTTTGAPTGSGPYTIPVPALGFAHASGVIISDYPTKTAGLDPSLISAATYGTVPWRFIASPNTRPASERPTPSRSGRSSHHWPSSPG